MLWIVAPGQELTVVRATKVSLRNKEKGIDEGDPLEIFLAPATETDFTVVDEQGRPVAGAVVEPWDYLTPRGIDFVLSGVRELLRQTTDASGHVRLISLSPRALYDVQFRATQFGTQQELVGGPGAAAPHGRITLRATGRIEGRLIGSDRQWLRGIKLRVGTRPRQRWTVPPLSSAQTEGESLVETDEQGRFRIPAIAEGAGTMVVAGLSTGSPVAPRPLSNLLVKAGETLHIDIPMEKLVLVKGTIRTDEPPALVAGAGIFVRYGKGFQSEMVISDHQGHFEAHVLPDLVAQPVIFLPRDLGTRYRQTGEPWFPQIEVPAGPKEFELPPIVLALTTIRRGTLIDQHGRPIAGAWVTANRAGRLYGFAVTGARGEFSLQLPKQPGSTSYNVQIPEVDLPFASTIFTVASLVGFAPKVAAETDVRTKATLLKYEPFTLQFNLTTAGEKAAKPKHHADASRTGKRQKSDERQPTSSTAPPPPPTNQFLIALNKAMQSEASAGLPTITGKVSESDGKPLAGTDVAAMVNGQPIYCSEIFERAYTEPLTADGLSLLVVAKNPGRVTGREVRQLQELAIRKYLKDYVKTRLLRQALEFKLEKKQKDKIEEAVGTMFEEYVEKLKKDLKVLTRAEVDQKLKESGTTLAGLKIEFRDRLLADEYLRQKSKKRPAVGRQEIGEYYEKQQQEQAIREVLREVYSHAIVTSRFLTPAELVPPEVGAGIPILPKSGSDSAKTTLSAAASKPVAGGPTITGKVQDSDIKPVAGATVMIWGAGVKHGYSTYCPGCYADCGKRAVTDGTGALRLPTSTPSCGSGCWSSARDLGRSLRRGSTRSAGR